MQKYLILFYIVVCSVPHLYAQENNQTILIEYIADLIIESVEAGQSFYLEMHPANQFALLELQSKLNEKNIFELISSKNNAKHILTITVDAENTLVTQSSQLHHRKLSARIAIQLIQTNDSIIRHSILKDYLFEDTIQNKDAELLAAGWYPARFHEMIDASRSSRWKRYLEPIIVTTAVATTVYLIYNVRSQ